MKTGFGKMSIMLIVIMGLFACGRTVSPPEVPPPLVGADRDGHGCIGSAGYSWCAKANACVRSWELAGEKGFGNDAESFRQYCTAGLKL